jgi:hypothetical protein
VHARRYQKAARVYQDVALAALDLLAGIEPARAAGFGGLDRLAVDDPGRRARLAAGGLARCHQQLMIDTPPGAVIAPSVEEPLHRGIGRELLGQQAPLATRGQQVEHGVDRLAQIGLARPPQEPWRRQVRLDQHPLVIGQIACVAQSRAPILRASDLGPGHPVAPSSLATTTNHNPLRSLNSFWVRL